MNQSALISTSLSDDGAKFIERHEGFVSTTYRDPVGILTLGLGFTNRSPAVRRHLGKIKPGMTITKEQARRVLRSIVDEEFGPAVISKLPGTKQHEFDAAASVSYNVGPRVLNWKWAKAYRAGDVAEAARLLCVTATTAQGRRLRGLVRRRAEEAALLEHARYGLGAAVSIEPSPDVVGAGDKAAREALIEYQEKLARLGLYDGEIDGLRGPKTTAAVRAFQEADPHLVDDGILGRATMASIDRQIEAAKSGRVGVGGASFGIVGTVLSWFQMLPPYMGYVVFALAVAALVYLVIKYRTAFEVKAREILGV
jgi:GH24 family phage-related lysozyme (muramidase)